MAALARVKMIGEDQSWPVRSYADSAARKICNNRRR